MSKTKLGVKHLQQASKVLKVLDFCPVPSQVDILHIRGGPFLRYDTASISTPMPCFPNLNLKIGHPTKERWAIVGPAGSGKTTLLDIVRGRCVGHQYEQRSYPALDALAALRSTPIDPLSLISYLGARVRDGRMAGAAGQGAHLSARFESEHDPSDLTLQDYLIGKFHLNPDEKERQEIQQLLESPFYHQLIEKFHLISLASQPLSSLSNGQTRRARIAKALISRPGLLLLDEPFTGLDPQTKLSFSTLLGDLSLNASLGVVCAFEDIEDIPDFVTHLIQLDSNHTLVTSNLSSLDPKQKSKSAGVAQAAPYDDKIQTGRRPETKNFSPWWWHSLGRGPPPTPGPKVVEISGAQVSYNGITVLGAGKQDINGTKKDGLWWDIHQGERWGVFGPNGSGKSTLLSLINSDHPQAYSQPIRVFGRTRLPSEGQPGLSIFDLQSRIGQASPEIHNFFPRHLSVRQTIESAWADTFRSPPSLSLEIDHCVDAALRWFEPLLRPGYAPAHSLDMRWNKYVHRERALEKYVSAWRDIDVDWADKVQFRDLDFCAQRVALFIRAVIRKPDLVFLDEAFGGMSAVARITCMVFFLCGESKFVQMSNKGAESPRIHRSKLMAFDALPRSDEGSERAVKIQGFEPRQTLLCVAHRWEDILQTVDRWIMLPRDGGRVEGDAHNKIETHPRFGMCNLRGNPRTLKTWWDSIWTTDSSTRTFAE